MQALGRLTLLKRSCIGFQRSLCSYHTGKKMLCGEKNAVQFAIQCKG